VARLQWDAAAIDLAPDARAWPGLPAARHRRLTTLLDDLADGALPGVREGVERVELDERWHIGFGLRCLIEARPSSDLLDDLLARAEDAAAALGDAVPPATRERIARMCARRLSVAGLTEAHAAA
jgi:ribonucleoside-diphosphate reductase beta chain